MVDSTRWWRWQPGGDELSHPSDAGGALGAYEITPLEAAGAYTMFANRGVWVKPSFLNMVRTDKGQ